MGSRGAFIDVDLNNFEFKSGGKHYRTLGVLKSNLRHLNILIRQDEFMP